MGVMKMGGELWSNLFHRPATEQYPFAPREYPEASRGHLEFDPSDCILCNICGKRCPCDAIRADKGSRTVTIERMQCIQCSFCADSCPKKCLTMRPGYTAPDSSKTVDTFQVPERGPTRSENRSMDPDVVATVVGHAKVRDRRPRDTPAARRTAGPNRLHPPFGDPMASPLNL